MNRRLYGFLAGRCAVHGSRGCEVSGEIDHVRRTRDGKRRGRRKARRRGWGEGDRER